MEDYDTIEDRVPVKVLYEQANSEFLYHVGIEPDVRAVLNHELSLLCADLFDKHEDALYVFDLSQPNTKDYFLYINNRLEDIIGFTKEEFYADGVNIVLNAWQSGDVNGMLGLHRSFFRRLFTMPLAEAYQQKLFLQHSFLRKDAKIVDLISTIQPFGYFPNSKPHLFLCRLRHSSPNIGMSITIPTERVFECTRKFIPHEKGYIHAGIQTLAQSRAKEQNPSSTLHSLEEILHLARTNSSTIVHEDVLLVRTLIEQHPGLTDRELQICILLRQQYRSKDIAAVVGISPGTLDNYRNSIRKKLGLQRSESLSTYLLRY